MDFKKATDQLFDGVSHADLAEELLVSIAAIRQARLSPKAKAFRQPPPGWENGALRLAKRESVKFQQLIEELQAEDKKDGRRHTT